MLRYSFRLVRYSLPGRLAGVVPVQHARRPVSCAGCEPLSTASPCGRLSRPRVLPVDLTPCDHRYSRGAPTWTLSGIARASQVLDASLHTSALFVDPGRPSGTSPWRSLCMGFWHVNTIAICIQLLRGCVKLQGVRTPLRAMWCPVYASVGSFGFLTLLSNCNTRYGWLVGPYRQGLSPARSAKLHLAH